MIGKNIHYGELNWILEQRYVTLVGVTGPEPGEAVVDLENAYITILIERANSLRRHYRGLYMMSAVVAEVIEGRIKLNGEEYTSAELGDALEIIRDLAREAVQMMAIGQGYLSDPEQS